MSEHLLHYSLALDLPRTEVFAFFADAANLELITPPELAFTIMTPLPIEMMAGALIDYRLSLLGVPFRWRTLITDWSPPDSFTDEQLAGPYRRWIHRHTFRDAPDGGTVIEDEVCYRLPFVPLGELAFPLVRKQLERIFRYRQRKVTEILQGGHVNREA